jgi:hypothetical protein
MFAVCDNDDVSVDWVGGIHATGHAEFGAQSVKASMHIDLQVVHAEPANGCGDIANGDTLAGKAVLIQRGVCTFWEKALNAQNADAAAVIIYNNPGGGRVSAMSAPDNSNITVLSIFLSQAHGERLAAAAAEATATVSLTCLSGRNHTSFRCTLFLGRCYFRLS